MVTTLLDFGIKSLDHLAATAAKRNGRALSRHPLAAYPCLQSLLIEAERSGTLAAERRRLLQRRLVA